MGEIGVVGALIWQLTSANSVLLFPTAISLLGKNFYPVKNEILCERDYMVSVLASVLCCEADVNVSISSN